MEHTYLKFTEVQTLPVCFLTYILLDLVYHEYPREVQASHC